MKKVLIANRGEIAVRIVRACADYGVRSVAVYADDDFGALHTRLADEAYGLAGRRPADSYLDAARLLAVAARCGADALHPGYGFLSESAGFAQAVIDAGLTWIGPPPAAIAALGDKVQARRIAQAVGAPLIAGTAGPVRDAAEVAAFAERHGLPVAIKAAFGGGGRGLKVAWRHDEVAEQYDAAVREAQAAFGRGACFVERFVDRPRHVEAQVIADGHGRLVVLGTRDCSLQRRQQKLVEEAPAPFLGAEQRQRIHQSAHDICAAAGYVGAGTVEFLLAPDGALAFLEVNTRLQVEHPVTEETSGIDLVVEQLRIADGLPLSVGAAPAPRGHAIEFRINAEDAGRGFLPSPGPVRVFDAPAGPGVRVDSGVAAGSTVPGAFDSLLAKLVVSGASRAQAIARARRALAEFRIDGVPTVLPFHRALLQHADFTAADGAAFQVHTRWIETDFAAPLAAAMRTEPLAEPPLRRTAIEVDGRRCVIGVPPQLWHGGWPAGEAGPPAAVGAADGDGRATAPLQPSPPFDGGPAGPAAAAGSIAAADAAGAAALPAPIAGSLQLWHVADGEDVAAGDRVASIEAMKMELQVTAHRAGRITRLVEPGAPVAAGAVLALIR